MQLRVERSVVIAQPTRQHSHRLAQALEKRERLLRFYTLLPPEEVRLGLPGWVQAMLPEAARRQGALGIDRGRIRTLPWPLVLHKVISNASAQGLQDWADLIAWSRYDHWVSKCLKHERPSVIVGYEMTSERTFEFAREGGITTVLDAAACHFSAQDRALGVDAGAVGRPGAELRRRKMRELELADLVICASRLACETYLNAGVAADRIVIIPPGYDRAVFAPNREILAGPARFAFVGTPSLHKGFDLLLAAFRELGTTRSDAELHVYGDEGRGRRIAGKLHGERIMFHGKLVHIELARALASMDCLVLPSRLESFGMVVLEALGVGVPVLVSKGAGAEMFVTEGVNGWTVPAGDLSALTSAMNGIAGSLDDVRRMRSACSNSVVGCSWESYEARVTELMERLYSKHS